VAGSSARDEPLPLWSDGPPRKSDFWAVARGALFLILLFWVPRILAAFPQVYVRTPVLAGTEAPPRCHRWGTSRIVGSVLVLKSLELALEDDAGLPDYCALVWGRRGGKVSIKAAGPLAPSTRAAIHAEAASMPIPSEAVTVSLTEH
jgi:hypothetical protein